MNTDKNQTLSYPCASVPIRGPECFPSLPDPNLRILRRGNGGRRRPILLEIAIEKGVNAIRCDSQLAPSVDPESAKQMKHAPEDAALQQRAIVAEGEMVHLFGRL